MISVLFVAKNSVYKTLGVDCWDEDRDALKWPGGNSIVAHPPCRLFSRMAHLSTAPKEEKQLAYWSVNQVRKWGGVLEHPAGSKLWKEKAIPWPGHSDEHGFSFGLDQFWFGHLGQKRTWLYIVGCSPKDLPDMPLRFGEPKNLFDGGQAGKGSYVPGSRHSGIRSATPPEFAKWLIAVAEKCTPELTNPDNR